MLSSVQIRGYRGFSDFEITKLGRVNLLVGKNNSGKTSVLEAIHLLASRGSPSSLWSVLWRRGERMSHRHTEEYPQTEIRHLFHGHESGAGASFSLSAENETPVRKLTFQIGEISEEQKKKEITRGGIPIPLRVGLHIKGNPAPVVEMIPLSRGGGMSSESLEARRRSKGIDLTAEAEMPTRFITTESVSGDDLFAVWDAVTLTPYEERVNAALRLLEPGIERIAPQAARSPYYGGGSDRSGFVVKMKGIEKPIPMGSLGDGIWRIMAMSILLAQCQDGVLMIDEIDTGLHYSVMTDMWKAIYGAAEQLNVQVFASTHSNDCVKSLAAFCCQDERAAPHITLHRIESGKKKSVAYSAAEIEIAAEKQIEVR